jgi:hypothetical protein
LRKHSFGAVARDPDHSLRPRSRGVEAFDSAWNIQAGSQALG